MTWVKLGDEYPDECAKARLSDAAFRTHTEALIWVMRRETGGLIGPDDIRRFAETADPQSAIRELVAARFWRAGINGTYHVTHHMDCQDDPELIHRRRRQAVERTQKWRRKRAGLDVDVPRDANVTQSRDADLARGVWSGRVGSGDPPDQPPWDASADPGGPDWLAPGEKRPPPATSEQYVNGASKARAALKPPETQAAEKPPDEEAERKRQLAALAAMERSREHAE